MSHRASHRSQSRRVGPAPPAGGAPAHRPQRAGRNGVPAAPRRPCRLPAKPSRPVVFRSPQASRLGCRGSFLPLVKMDPHHRRGSFFVPAGDLSPAHCGDRRHDRTGFSPPVFRPNGSGQLKPGLERSGVPQDRCPPRIVPKPHRAHRGETTSGPSVALGVSPFPSHLADNRLLDVRGSLRIRPVPLFPPRPSAADG